MTAVLPDRSRTSSPGKPANLQSVVLRVKDRGDGGISIRSDQVPGLLVDSKEPARAWARLPEMIIRSLRVNHATVVRDVDVGVLPDYAGEPVQISAALIY